MACIDGGETINMNTKYETIELLDELIEAMENLHKMWDDVECWSEANLGKPLKDAA